MADHSLAAPHAMCTATKSLPTSPPSSDCLIGSSRSFQPSLSAVGLQLVEVDGDAVLAEHRGERLAVPELLAVPHRHEGADLGLLVRRGGQQIAQVADGVIFDVAHIAQRAQRRRRQRAGCRRRRSRDRPRRRRWSSSCTCRCRMPWCCPSVRVTGCAIGVAGPVATITSRFGERLPRFQLSIFQFLRCASRASWVSGFTAWGFPSSSSHTRSAWLSP